MPDTHSSAPATTASAPAPLPLQRFTTTYDASQDRISLVGQGADEGRVHTLWLTQRLLRRLLPTLWQWLERHDAPQTDAASVLAASHDSQRNTALHAMAQQAAHSQMPSGETPVQPGPFSPQWLVCSVQLQATAQSVELLLSNAQDDNAPLALDHASARLALGPQPLRQWLSILLQLHRQAEWPVDHWPQWLAASADTAPAPGHRPTLH